MVKILASLLDILYSLIYFSLLSFANGGIDDFISSNQDESILYLSYQKKAEIIKLEHGLFLNRQTVYYHESVYADSFITQKEKIFKN